MIIYYYYYYFFVTFTGKKYRKLGDKLDRSLTGKVAERPRWDTCMRRLYGTFGVPMSALYVKDHFDPGSLEKVRFNYILFKFLFHLT